MLLHQQHNEAYFPPISDEVITDQFVEVMLANGQRRRIQIGRRLDPVIGPKEEDHVKNYGHLTLEFGLVYMYFLQLCHSPHRMKFLATLKMMMLMLKAKNRQAKYPLEILRYLIQQCSLLPEDRAIHVFYSNFVNQQGRLNTFLPADQNMEWCVRQNKRLIKHMYSNKSNENIAIKSAAMPGLAEIGEEFDKECDVVHRSKAHSTRNVEIDELRMIRDLGNVKPFQYQPGRKFESTKLGNMVPSIMKLFDGSNFQKWFDMKKTIFRP